MRRILAVLAALALSACATTPVADERAMAQEVFRLSGGLDDVKLVVRLAPSALAGADVAKRCRDSLGRNPNPLASAACDMVETMMGSMREGEGQLNRALESQLQAMEARAVDAMVETYTASELAAMRRYYDSPEGRAIVAKRSEYLSRLFGAR
jgi:hypothetical protein